MLLWIRERVTFANVVSLLALFVALGGTSYAVSQIDGAQIRNRSISGKKLKTHSVTSKEIKAANLSVARAKLATRANQATTAKRADHAVLSDTVKQLHVTAAKNWHGRKVGPTTRTGLARAASSATSTTPTLVGLQAGQSLPLFKSGTFTVTAECIDGSHELLTATSTENGWYAFPSADPAKPYENTTSVYPPYSANQRVIVGEGQRLAMDTSQVPYPLELEGSDSLAAPSGDSLNLPIVWGGLSVFGYACVVNAVAFG